MRVRHTVLLLSTSIVLMLLIHRTLQAQQTVANATVEQEDRMQWWREARFGMFIHWGLYSVLGGEWEGQDYGKEMGGASAEWIMLRAPVPTDKYEELAKRFNPIHFNSKRQTP